jgi:hypothetical protein
MRLKPNLVLSRVGDEAVLLDLDGTRYLTANPVAATILETWQNGGDDAQAVANIVARFAVDPTVAAADLAAFAARIQQLRLVQA